MKKNYLSKNTSLMIHGIAILMMIYHHGFINGNTWYVQNPSSIFDIFNPINIGLAPTAQQTFAWFCRICVSVFAFISGYAIFIQYESKVKDENDFKQTYKIAFKRIFSFYKKYLFAFLFFSTCEIAMGNPDGLYITPKTYLLTMLGLAHYVNETWWYVRQYYLMICLSPILYFILKKYDLKKYCITIGIVALSIIIAFVSGNGMIYLKTISGIIQKQYLIITLIFLEGMFCAQYNLINIVADKLNFLTSLIVLIMTYLLRAFLLRGPGDPLFDLVLITPFIISIVRLLSYSKYIAKMLEFLGKYSTHMWFNHSYFYAYLFFDLVVQSDLSLLVFIQTVILSLTTAIIFTMIENLIHHLTHKKTSSV